MQWSLAKNYLQCKQITDSFPETSLRSGKKTIQLNINETSLDFIKGVNRLNFSVKTKKRDLHKFPSTYQAMKLLFQQNAPCLHYIFAYT